MKTFIAALVLAGLVAFPAFAQSYDPDLGTGNIAPYSASTPYSANVAQPGSAGAARVPGGFGSAAKAYGAVTPSGTPGAANSGNQSASARDTALRECSVLERSFNGVGGNQDRWGAQAVTLYRSCMMQHGQPE